MNSWKYPNPQILGLKLFCVALLILAFRARGSITYGTINHFDTVISTHQVCPGFELELEGCRSHDVARVPDL